MTVPMTVMRQIVLNLSVRTMVSAVMTIAVLGETWCVMAWRSVMTEPMNRIAPAQFVKTMLNVIRVGVVRMGPASPVVAHKVIRFGYAENDP
jgi:hypothetical protein